MYDGCKNPNYGKVTSEKIKQKIREKTILQLSTPIIKKCKTCNKEFKATPASKYCGYGCRKYKNYKIKIRY